MSKNFFQIRNIHQFMSMTHAFILKLLLISLSCHLHVCVEFNPLYNNLSFIHIPKTAGTSFKVDIFDINQLLGKVSVFDYNTANGSLNINIIENYTNKISFLDHLKKEVNFNNHEECYYEAYNPSNFNVIIFRNPRDHVYSQFLEVKYDAPFGHFARGTGFPFETSDEKGFEIWLDHFNVSLWGVNSLGDYRTYNPINMQTRFLTCYEQSHHIILDKNINQIMNDNKANIYNHRHIKLSSALQNHMPDLQKAEENLKSIDIIGITEFYSTFICMFIYRTLHVLPVSCDCQYEGHIADGSRMHTHFVIHSVPRHSWMLLSHSLIDQIDTLTLLDVEIYKFAMDLFLNQVEEVEKKTQKQILCHKQVNELLSNTLKYMDLHRLQKRIS